VRWRDAARAAHSRETRRSAVFGPGGALRTASGDGQRD
jgi:hypothetical protein